MTFELPAPGASNTSDILPIICADLEMGSAVVWVDIVPVGDFVHKEFTVSKNLGLDSIGSIVVSPLKHTTRQRDIVAWDGELKDSGGKYVPEGEYKVVIRALRFYGDAMNPADYDTWESPTLHIMYKES